MRHIVTMDGRIEEEPPARGRHVCRNEIDLEHYMQTGDAKCVCCGRILTTEPRKETR